MSKLSLDNQGCKLLLHGIDTIQCAYYLENHKNEGAYIDYALITRQKESIRQSKKKDPMPVVLGNSEFLLHSYGSSSGYPLIISNNDFKIEMGEFNMPNFFVTFTSEALWRESAYLLHEKFLGWADSVGYKPMINESLSRVDFCFDYKLPDIDFNEDYFVSYSKKTVNTGNAEPSRHLPWARTTLFSGYTIKLPKSGSKAVKCGSSSYGVKKPTSGVLNGR
jgi:hypothetical protein